MERIRLDAGKGHPTALSILSSQPRLTDTEYWIMDAFADLCSERPAATYTAPIPITKIIEYAKLTGVDPENIDFFVSAIRTVDSFTVNKNNKSNKRNS